MKSALKGLRRLAPRVALDRPLVLVGMMGVGKSSLGRRLARRLGVPFHDSDEAVVEAAGCPIPDIFQRYGEAAFRDAEARVIARLLGDGPQVLATGGGAFMAPATRRRVKDQARSIWLTADLPILVKRTAKRGDRPLLKGEEDPAQVLARLLEQRSPAYAEADLTVDTSSGGWHEPLETILDWLRDQAADATDTAEGEAP